LQFVKNKVVVGKEKI